MNLPRGCAGARGKSLGYQYIDAGARGNKVEFPKVYAGARGKMTPHIPNGERLRGATPPESAEKNPLTDL